MRKAARMRPSLKERTGWHGRKRRFRKSLMAKMLIILVVAGALVDFCVGGFFRWHVSGRSHAAMQTNVMHYARTLAREIGTPPDTLKARKLAERYFLRIRYQGPLGDPALGGRDPSGAWESGPGAEFPSARGPGTWFHEVPAEASAGEAPAAASDKIGWRRGRFFVEVNQSHGRFLIATDFKQGQEGHGIFLALLIGMVSAILTGAYFAIRRLLSPLKSLTAAVERMGRGELGHQVSVCTRDELGDLARSFNSMSTGLKEMVRSREQLLLDVSHELRSPLTRIKVALEMSPEGTARESIRDDVGEMETMIAEILETARLDSANGKLHLEPLDLGALVAEAVADADIRAPGARLAAPPLPGGPSIKADRARVRKVLANVLDNAVKFSQAGNVPVEVRVEEGISEVTVTVKDRGVGIPGAELSRLFEPFYRVDRSRSRETGGYGLGLSLCKRIMEAHGGRISIASREGEGTEVSLVFPKA